MELLWFDDYIQLLSKHMLVLITLKKLAQTRTREDAS